MNVDGQDLKKFNESLYHQLVRLPPGGHPHLRHCHRRDRDAAHARLEQPHPGKHTISFLKVSKQSEQAPNRARAHTYSTELQYCTGLQYSTVQYCRGVDILLRYSVFPRAFLNDDPQVHLGS